MTENQENPTEQAKLFDTKDIETLTIKLKELEEQNKLLTNKVNEYEGVKTLDELETKLTTLEQQKTNLVNYISTTEQEQKNLINNLEDKIRYITLQETELETHFRTLKFKIPELFELKCRQEKVLKTMQYRYSDIGYNSIINLEDNINELLDTKRNLEERVAQIRKEHNTITDDLQQRTRDYSIKNTERESEILKLKSNLKELDRINDELKSQVDVSQNKSTKALDMERDKGLKLKENLETVRNENENLLGEKNRLQDENEYLKRKLRKLKQKLETFAM